MRPGGERWIAPYASRASQSRGRVHPELPSPTRSEFQRDRDRIIHSTAFRRLTHKTQVFVFHEGDHYRTRLTHTLEVSQIARAVARSLGLDEDLAEALALSHDLGHPPFGHTGEDTLSACMAEWGGFDHNAQALRIVTRLERRYGAFDGLNLTWETLEGLVKHNGPLLDRAGEPSARYRTHGIPGAFLEQDRIQPLDLSSQASAEAQAAAIADDIAYNAHDLDDGLRAGMFALSDLREVAFLSGLLDEIAALHSELEPSRLVQEVTRRVITRLVEDVLEESSRRIEALQPSDAAAIRAAGRPVVSFSPGMKEVERSLKRFLSERVYRSPRLGRVRAEAESVVRNLFEAFRDDPELMPMEWSRGLGGRSTAAAQRRIADYIAGMTDGYALAEHRRLFGNAPDLRVS